MKQRKLGALFVTVVSLGVFVSSNAFAVGGTCKASTQTRGTWLPGDDWRVRASCSSLQSDSKARGVLDINNLPAASTAWFTDIGVVHYSGWRTPWPATPKARAEIGKK